MNAIEIVRTKFHDCHDEKPLARTFVRRAGMCPEVRVWIWPAKLAWPKLTRRVSEGWLGVRDGFSTLPSPCGVRVSWASMSL